MTTKPIKLLLGDENFPRPVITHLKEIGYDAVTVRELGEAGKKFPDNQVLQLAISQGRVVLTHDREDFKKLHRQNPDHAGIVLCTMDDNFEALAQRIHEALSKETDMKGRLIRINRPQA